MDDIDKPLTWIGSSKDDLLDLPCKAQREVGYALYLAQLGLESTKVKPLTGFRGRGAGGAATSAKAARTTRANRRLRRYSSVH